MSNMCPIPNKHLCSLYHQWLVSRWEDEYDDQSFFKVKVYLTSLCSWCWGHPRCDDEFIFHRSEYITHNPLSQMTYQNLPLISYDPSLLMTITDDLSPITITYDLWLCLISYALWLWPMTMTCTLWLWLSHITHDYDLSPLMTFISYHLFINNHHLWLIIHNSSYMSMTSHPWLLYMTIIYDHDS